jgi:hypothetical protein
MTILFQQLCYQSFEMFFYFEKEPLFVNDDFWTEKKREYLNKYPTFAWFFFQKSQRVIQRT